MIIPIFWYPVTSRRIPQDGIYSYEVPQSSDIAGQQKFNETS